MVGMTIQKLGRARFPALLVPAVLGLIAARVASAQGTRADYERATSLGARTRDTVFRDRVEPRWLPGGAGFWYRVRTGPGTHEFVLVDAEAGTRAPAFDHARLADELGKALGKPVSGDALPLDGLAFADDATSLTFRAGERRWRFDIARSALREAGDEPPADEAADDPDAPRASRRTGDESELVFVNRMPVAVELFWLDPEGRRQSYGKLEPGQERRQHTFDGHAWIAADERGRELIRVVAVSESRRVEIRPGRRTPPAPNPRGRPGRGRGQATSPDGRWVASIREQNVWVRDTQSGDSFALSADGNAEAPYEPRVYWAPDSTRLVAVKVAKAQEHKVHLVESSPRDQLQPKLHTIDYLKPGDRIARPRPRLFDVAGRRGIFVSDALFPNPWSLGEYRWDPDSRRFTFLYNQRGHQVLRLIAVDAQTGATTALIDEQSPTFLDYAHKLLLRWIDSTNDILWMSERSGWNHLYRIDGATGAVKNPITSGDWVVRRVEQIDPERNRVWFFAGGVRPEQDPYYLHLCRANLDGTGFVVLTEGDGNHAVAFSPDRRYFLDTWSRVDQPPTIELRDAEDGRLIVTLERAEASALLSTGWNMPERFVAKGRDGATDIYGVIFRPADFDPARKYPVVEQIYAGPQGAFVPKSWGLHLGPQSLVQLGFVVVQIDGMGTNWRSKAFHDVCWKNLADAGLPDRIAWMRAAAADRPWMDLTRVGVYGGSAGGQNALGALLLHGDFYKVGVADCGCHDNRMDKIWWNELWMGWPVGPEYAESSNVTHAHKLQGKLLLIVGELDRNVDPASTMQVANALVKADKDFDLLIIPGAGHGSAETPYGRRRRMDFLVRHLHGVEPRGEFEPAAGQ
jgi:dipeptidyl-peptidase-4